MSIDVDDQVMRAFRRAAKEFGRSAAEMTTAFKGMAAALNLPTDLEWERRALESLQRARKRVKEANSQR